MIFLYALGGVAFGCAIWGIGIERYLFTVRHESAKVLPRGAKPIRVLHVSDFHVAPWQRRKLSFIKKLSELDVDLVIDTGDNLGHPKAIKPTLAALDGLLSVPGAFVNGSNDYHAPGFRNPFAYLFRPSDPGHAEPLDNAALVAGLTAGWLNLNNASGELIVKGTRIGFVGVDDPHDGLADYNSVVEPKNVDITIGVAHAPYRETIEALGFSDIIFAGHTHGGQVCLPGGRALTTNCDLPNRYARGQSVWETAKGKTILQVCAGLGTSIFAPVRFFCRPEIRVVTLLPKA